MPKYKVSFMKIQSYEVEAANIVDAEDIGLDMLNADKNSFTHDYVDKIKVEEIIE